MITVLEANKLVTQVEELDDINVPNEPSTFTCSTSRSMTVAQYSDEHNIVQIQGPPPKRQKQLTLMNRFSLPPESKVDQFNKAVIEMIAEDMQPLSIVENRGFRKLINLLDSRYKLPSCKLIGTTLIPNLYESTRKIIETILSHTKYVSLTSDIWTSLQKLESSHTAQYLSEVLKDIIKEWKIETKVAAIVTDSVENIKAAIKLLKIEHIPCAAHKLNNAVKNSLKSEFEENDIDTNQTEEIEMMKLVKICHSIIGHFKHSNPTRILHEKQKQLNSPVLKLKQDIAIRWISTLIMMKCLLIVKEPLMLVSMGLPQCPDMPSNEQWQIINDFVILLKPFESLTIQLSSKQRPTLSKIIP
ncbi:E3 SUMO-protein ligase ZBED1-like [Metopolophium dirhodum]|uniref:E3 SUMO-protein ligase ZBED1-like n=1 Tax=Metopolophium dirhodum TaxID=44670 RepID=UPI00299045F7|nr:E3 SUMO-protein ligase ZBED1-like [Metopolophium dirhodum]